MIEEQTKHPYDSDHDTLIALYVEVKQLRTDILLNTNAQGVKIADHESRIRRLEYYGALLAGVVMVLQLFKDKIANLIK